MAGPVARLVYKAKGEKGISVGAIWKKEWDSGDVSYNLSPKVEADEYGSMTTQEALDAAGRKEGFLNIYFNESIAGPDADDF